MKTALILGSVLLIAAGAVHGERRGPVSIAEAEARSAERFAAIDVDGDERISSAEFAAADLRRGTFMRGDHHRKRWSGRAGLNFVDIDADGNGSISRDEFDAAKSAGHRRGKRSRDGDGGKPDKAALKEKLFARLDADENGFLSQAEFGKPVERLRALDANGDGQVDRDERRSGHRKRDRG
ncbi:MAG: hypothetical protein OXG51_15770 [Gammaproteobacteria bacterium]|nr:hypothetical protein [Gammaproteobacteria bacterium]